MSFEKKRRGRPRGKVRETHTVYLRLPTEMVEAIRSLARAKGWTVNRWVETAIHDVITGEEPWSDGHAGGAVALDGNGRAE